MTTTRPSLRLEFARTEADHRSAQALRYRVFVKELGGDGPLVDHDAGLERDIYDTVADQLLLRDDRLEVGNQVVGVYRLMNAAQAQAVGGFSSSPEYDLAPLLNSNRKVLELGRSCVHPNYRGGTAMFQLWRGLARHVAETGTEVLFGVASFHGTDVAALAQPLSMLHRDHLAPPDMRVRSKAYERMDILPPSACDKRAATRVMPALIKAYLRLGGCVGDGAFVDHAFNTTDVCTLLDLAQLSLRQRAIYGTNK